MPSSRNLPTARFAWIALTPHISAMSNWVKGVRSARVTARPTNSRPIAHHRAQRLVADRTDLHLARRVDIVIEPLERKAVQVDEIARDMDAGDITLLLALDGAEDVSLDQDRAAVGLHAAGQQTRTVVMLLHAFHQPLDILQIVEAEVVTQASGEEIAGQGEACRSQEFGGRVHWAR